VVGRRVRESTPVDRALQPPDSNVDSNAGSRVSRFSAFSAKPVPYLVVVCLTHHNILWLAPLAGSSEFHLYYDI
jgi:hypothetical protein